MLSAVYGIIEYKRPECINGANTDSQAVFKKTVWLLLRFIIGDVAIFLFQSWVLIDAKPTSP